MIVDYLWRYITVSDGEPEGERAPTRRSGCRAKCDSMARAWRRIGRSARPLARSMPDWRFTGLDQAQVGGADDGFEP